MNRPYPFQDFVRVHDVLKEALVDPAEGYLLVTGETGTGKSALLRELRGELDRTRFRVLYFAESRRLGAAGFVRVIARQLRAPTSLSHAESLHHLLRALGDESQRLLVWIDEAHELPEETLAQARALVEADLDGQGAVQVLLAGLPRLRAELQAHPPLWRRVFIREQITGLVREEVADFLEHHFGKAVERLGDQIQTVLFERAAGSPGILLPMTRTVLAKAGGKGEIDPVAAEDWLDRWDLP